MTRSAVVAVVAWVILVGALIVVDSMYWGWLTQRSRLELALVLALPVFAASLTAVSIRRIVDPKLDVPVLVWIAVIAVGLVLFVMYVVAQSRKHDRNNTHEDDNRRGLFGRNRSSSDSGSKGVGMGRAWAIVSTILSLGAYAAGIALTVWLATAARERGAAPVLVAVAPVEAPGAPSAPPAPTDIIDVADLAAAIAFAKPSLTDTRDAPSAGTRLLVRYAAAKLHWREVVVAKNETSPELVEKDPANEIGKRLCAAGTLARIEKLTVDGTELHAARLVTRTGDAIEMFVIGSTGKLVKRKQARFCGIVTGRLDSAGKPATFAVGMFEQPSR